LQEKYKEEVVKNTVNTSTTRRSPLTAVPSMIAEVKLCECEIWYLLLLLIAFFLKVCSVRWGAGLQEGHAAEAKFVITIF
jgi:hypothetical protein